jgi:uncharacterized sulfatase
MKYLYHYPKTIFSRSLSFSPRVFSLFIVCCIACQPNNEKRPNILFCIADDQSYIHTSFQGTNEINTPHFDRIARNGILFQNAYCNASSCAPSRASILTGKNIWELEEGGLLFGGLRKNYVTFPHVLKQKGYETGYTGKGYAPATKNAPYHSQPIARSYNNIKMDAPDGISNNDYAANFREFFSNRDKQKPFFFWYGGSEPHRAYKQGIGAASGKDISKIQVPGFLPNTAVVRSDIADYYYEIEWFDSHLGRMIKTLEEAGELDNTIIITTADNGMPFPRAKTTCYDYGTHLPLAIMWGDKIKAGLTIEDFVSFTDFAPTLLEAAGIAVPEDMTGNSFLDVMLANKSGQIDSTRNRVFTALERHTYCRPDGMPYPIRTIRKGDWLFLVNFAPDRWPSGGPDFLSPHQGFYGDIDAGPTREFIIKNKEDASINYYYNLSVAKRPSTELFNIKDDPFQLVNLASAPEYADLCKELKVELFAYLSKTKDPRMEGLSPWDNYPYFFKGYDKRHLKPVGSRDVDQG